MSAGAPADWRDRCAYQALLELDRSGWAWEWLRRNPGYRQAASGHVLAPRAIRAIDPGAAEWGLHCFEDPETGAARARPLWRKDWLPGVISLFADPGAGPDCFDVGCCEDLATMVAGASGVEHWLIGNGLRFLRLDVVGGSLLRGPARLSFSLEGLQGVEPRMAALGQMVDLWRTGCLNRDVELSRARAVRLARLLRVSDALAAGATQREIAEALFDPSVRQGRWRIERPTVRLQVQRLARSSRLMMAGGYRTALGAG